VAVDPAAERRAGDLDHALVDGAEVVTVVVILVLHHPVEGGGALEDRLLEGASTPPGVGLVGAGDQGRSSLVLLHERGVGRLTAPRRCRGAGGALRSAPP